MQRYALFADRIWDGVADSAQAPGAVIVESGRISAVCLPREVPADVQRVALDGCTLLPGLIDAHVHYCDAMGPAYLAAGVTTVRDVGNDLDWILAQRERNAHDPARGPGLVCCGMLLDGAQPGWNVIGRAHTDEASIRRSVREHIERGVDALKFYAFLDAPLLRAGIEEAHTAGKTAISHLQNVRWDDAVSFGLDQFEHLANCDTAWRHATETEDDAAIDALLAGNAVIDPTLVLWDRLGGVLDRAFHHDERRQWMHPIWLEIWNRYRTRFRPPSGRLTLRGGIPHLKRFLLRAQHRDMTIALGTDTPFPHLFPGFAVHDELVQYVDAGLRPIDALRSATSVNAQVLGIAARAGRIAPGFNADLIAVRGNPLKRIEDIEAIRLVIRHGQTFDPRHLLRQTQRRFHSELNDPVTCALWDKVNQPL